MPFIENYWFLTPVLALFFGVLALAPLGLQVLTRGVVFIDLAIAQAAAACALCAGIWLSHPSAIETQLTSALGALMSAALVAALIKAWPAQREALIGLIYVMGASLAMLGARLHPHGRERLAELLAADILWASWSQVAQLAICALILNILQFWRGRWMHLDFVFYITFALVASVAVPVLGLFVMFVALIAPALWLRKGTSWRVALVSTFLAAAFGLSFSWFLDLPSGSCVALALGIWGVMCVFKKTALQY